MKESDIRPQALHDRYLELSLQDAKRMQHEAFVSISCPACGASPCHQKLRKNNFSYACCHVCSSVFCSPRPTQADLNKMYENSESAHYWANVFFPAVAEARREKLFRKKAEKIAQLFEGKNIRTICDVGAGYGIFLEELQKFYPSAQMCAIEPGTALARKCREKGFETLETDAEHASDWHGRFDLVICSEVIEHVFDPSFFCASLYKLAKKGGNTLVTGLGYEGFDIVTLQEHSKSIFPPHHLNFLSVQGFETLFSRAGFCHVHVFTPGELDVDIVLNSENPPEFVKLLAKREGALHDFQGLLRKYKLSSHVWVTAER